MQTCHGDAKEPQASFDPIPQGLQSGHRVSPFSRSRGLSLARVGPATSDWRGFAASPPEQKAVPFGLAEGVPFWVGLNGNQKENHTFWKAPKTRHARIAVLRLSHQSPWPEIPTPEPG